MEQALPLKTRTKVMGFQKIGAPIAAATGLTVPSKDPRTGEAVQAKQAVIVCEAQAVRWRDDGTDPTAAIGSPLAVGATLVYDGDLNSIKFIEQVGGAILNVTYYA